MFNHTLAGELGALQRKVLVRYLRKSLIDDCILAVVGPVEEYIIEDTCR